MTRARGKLVPVSLCHHCEHFEQIIERLDRIMAGQASIDAAVAAINTTVSTVEADTTAIQAQLAAGTPVNTDALDAAVATLAPAVNGLTALVTPPAASPTT